MRTRKYNRHHIRTQKKRKRRNKKKRTLQRGGSRRSLQKYSGTGTDRVELAEQVRSYRAEKAAEKAAIGFVGKIFQMVTTESRFNNIKRFPKNEFIGTLDNLKNRLPERNEVQAETDIREIYKSLTDEEKELAERYYFVEIEADIDDKNQSVTGKDVENTVAFLGGIGREGTRSQTAEAKAAAEAEAAQQQQPEVGTTLPKTTSGSSVFTEGTEPNQPKPMS